MLFTFVIQKVIGLKTKIGNSFEEKKFLKPYMELFIENYTSVDQLPESVWWL
jgi:hypothetical protein